MRLKGWFIEGFGVFRDYEVNNLPAGLTVFAGPNEAGKSTLLAFLRGVLFGFPDGRSREAGHVPLRGGRHGGRIILEGRDGDCIVERFVGSRQPVRVTLPDGRPAADADLNTLLGGADDRLFRSVFAFSLTELQSFESLSAEGVRDRIFSAGIAGTGRSSRGASQQLRTRTETLLNERGQATINDLVHELEAMNERIDAARRASMGHAELLAHELGCRGEIERLTIEMESLNRTRAHHQLLLDAWPIYDELQVVSADLERCGSTPDYPAQAEAKLAAALQALENATGALNEIHASRERSRAKRAELRLDDALLWVTSDVEQLHEKLALQQNLLSQQPGIRQRVAQAAEALSENLASLGPAWDPALVESFDASIPRQEEVRGWQDALDHVTTDTERARAELDVATRHRDDLQQSRDRLAATLDADLPETEALENQAAALRRLRATLSDLATAEASVAAADRQAKDRDRERRLIESDVMIPLPTWTIIATCTAALASVVGVVLLASSGPWSSAAPLGFVVLALVIGAVLLGRRRSRECLIAEQQEENLAAIEDELSLATTECDRARLRVVRLSSAARSDGDVLGLEFPPSAQAVENRAAELERQKTERLQWKDVQARLAEVIVRHEAAVDVRAEVADRLAAAERTLSDRTTEWSDWKADRQIPATLSPQGVLDYFEAIRTCRGLVQSLRTAENDDAQITARVSAWTERARTALTATGQTVTSGDEALLDRVAALRKQCLADRTARTTASALDQELQQIDARVDVAAAERDRCQRELDSLLADAGCADVSSYRAGLELYQRRVGFETRRDDLESRLSAAAGRSDSAGSIREELASGDIDGWRQALTATTPRAEELQRQRDEAIGRHRDAERARVEVETSAELPTLAMAAASLRAELEAAIDTWRTTTLARALIDDTLGEFERNRQPAVLADASRTFALVTQGRYDRVVQDANARDISVLDARGGRRSVDALSRGTAEQLYLCIRLALASEFGRRSEPLPLVLDDVFVNFDPERARAIAQVVAQFAETHQVLAFTCHPSTRDLLLSVAPEAGLVELQPVQPLAARVARRSDDPQVDQGTVPAASAVDTPAPAINEVSDAPLVSVYEAVRPASGE